MGFVLPHRANLKVFSIWLEIGSTSARAAMELRLSSAGPARSLAPPTRKRISCYRCDVTWHYHHESRPGSISYFKGQVTSHNRSSYELGRWSISNGRLLFKQAAVMCIRRRQIFEWCMVCLLEWWWWCMFEWADALRYCVFRLIGHTCRLLYRISIGDKRKRTTGLFLAQCMFCF